MVVQWVSPVNGLEQKNLQIAPPIIITPQNSGEDPRTPYFQRPIVVSPPSKKILYETLSVIFSYISPICWSQTLTADSTLLRQVNFGEHEYRTRAWRKKREKLLTALEY